MKFRMRGLAAAAVAGALALATMPGVAEATTTDIDYKITSPYASVDWDWAQYKAGFHNHTTESDGGNTARQMLEQAYALGFNVYAMTDHNFTNTTWDRTDTAKAQANPEYYLTTERMVEMNTGADRNGLPGMIGTGDSNEQSIKDHLNTFWTPGYLNPAGSTLESKIATVDAMPAWTARSTRSCTSTTPVATTAARTRSSAPTARTSARSLPSTRPRSRATSSCSASTPTRWSAWRS